MSSALRKLRIIALPLTSRTLPYPKAKSNRLVYYQFQITVPSSRLDQENETASTNTRKKGWIPEEGIVKWATNKAADMWAGFGKEKSGWKVCFVVYKLCLGCSFYDLFFKSRVYQAGERMMDRVEFEELSLKNIDLSISPSLAQFRSSPISEDNKMPLTVRSSFNTN